MTANPSDDAAPQTPRSRWQGRLSISITLATAIGLLVGVAVLVVLVLGLGSAGRNTLSLLSQNAELAIDSATESVRRHLRAAEAQTAYVRRLIETGALDPGDRPALARVLTGALAAAPQIDAVFFVDASLKAVRVVRTPGRPLVDIVDVRGDPDSREGMKAMARRGKAYWGPPVWRKDQKKTYLNMRQPVMRDGRMIGALFSVVSVRELSGYLDRLAGAAGAQPFILYDRRFVLAHPAMAGGYPGRARNKPVPPLLGFTDPVLASIWQKENRYEMFIKLPKGVEGHVLRIFNDDYVYVYRRLEGFGDKPMLVGAYFRSGDIGAELRRLVNAGIAGLVALVLALLIAVFIGRRIARPIKTLSAEATRIGELDIADVKDLPGSVFRELNDQSQAFNTMLRGLRWFEAYVPKRLVERLIARGEPHTVDSVERDLTIMFTDIAGYTSLSEGADAAEVAALLNHHFGLVAACIEKADGTVDKFIGDSVMAFWGAPDKQKNRAVRACQAARAIARAVEKDNAARKRRGEPPIRMRIGLHRGLVTVGNIGAPGRVNYTIVGDAVNVAARIEQQAKDHVRKGEEVTVLMSGETRAHLGKRFKVKRVGEVAVRGRKAPVELYRLAGGGTNAPGRTR